MEGGGGGAKSTIEGNPGSLRSAADNGSRGRKAGGCDVGVVTRWAALWGKQVCGDGGEGFTGSGRINSIIPSKDAEPARHSHGVTAVGAVWSACDVGPA